MDNQAIEYPVIGGQYKHYKGGLYRVLTMANHTETGEALVIYQSLLFGSIHARPLTMFMEKLGENGYMPKMRFTLQQNDTK